ncbi:MAG: SDR family NAD(P)-dependent oxidoreductase [Dehalococcoidia bacterium]|nr:SDR family NAD(P)-dependent oxidoreductase [Dehalococcoidia bacterium]
MERVLVTGGAGFIGSNLVSRLLAEGCSVTVLDNLSRAGVRANVAWLQSLGSPRLTLIRGDIRDRHAVETAICGVDTVFHLAAQVAVTTSVSNPREDFEVNALGAFNVLDAARRQEKPPAVIFTSTNKVYGAMEDVEVSETAQRYILPSYPDGISEERPLDFHSPYGCSKGTADQYTIDFSRIYGLRTAVFRMSCIYGPRQFGNEDQGWVAHFGLRALAGEPITIFGDGKQVRDILYVDDLIAALLAARQRAEQTPTQVYNVGGGPANTVSLLELLALLEERLGRPIARCFGAWRPGDQRVYISDIRKIRAETGWSPQVGVEEGIDRLLAWLRTLR